MESLCSSSLHPNASFCSLRPIAMTPNHFLPRLTTKPSLNPSLLLLRTTAASHSASAKPESPGPLLSLLKPLSFTLATAAASFSILLCRFPSASPPLALAASVSDTSAPVSDTLIEPQTEPDSDPDQIVASLRAEVENKIEEGDFTGAIQTLDRLISLQPGNSDLILLKAHLQSHIGDVSSAKKSFESILEKDPYLVEAYHGLIVTTSNSESVDTELREMMKRVENTIELCKMEKDSKEKVRDFKLLLAQIKVILGEYEGSLKVYGEMEKEEPTDFRPYLCKGIVYTLLKKKEEADGQFKKYKRLVPQGHPYEKFFDEMVDMKIFGEMQEAKKVGSLNN